MQGEVAHHPVRHPEDGVEGAERILEHHCDLAAVPEQLAAAVQLVDRSAGVTDLASGRLVDAREQARNGALAAAALTNQRDDFALMDGQVEIVDRVQHLRLPEHAAQSKVTRQVDRAQ